MTDLEAMLYSHERSEKRINEYIKALNDAEKTFNEYKKRVKSQKNTDKRKGA